MMLQESKGTASTSWGHLNLCSYGREEKNLLPNIARVVLRLVLTELA